MDRRRFLGFLTFATSAIAIPGIAAATASQKAAVSVSEISGLGGFEQRVRMLDGRSMIMWVRDLGDRIPGWDMNENRFDAYTTHFRLEDGTEIYAQTDKALADISGDVNAFRMQEDVAFLEAIGVDPSSL